METEDLEKIWMANVMCMIGVVIMSVFGADAVLRHDSVFALILFGCAALMLLLMLIHFRTRNYELVTRAGVTAVAFVFFYFLCFGGDSQTAYVWSFTFPLFAIVLLGSKVGSIMSLSLLAITISYFVSDPWFPSWADYHAALEIRFGISYAVIAAFALLVQRLKESSYRTIRLKNQAVEAAKNTAIRASQAKSDFLANISHEFRTPLNHIIGFSELLCDQKVGHLDPDQLEYITDVYDSGQHLLSLVNDVLDMAKIEAGRMELEQTKIDLDELLNQSDQMVRESASHRRIRITKENLSSEHSIRGDLRKLQQVLYNLLSNAVKFTPDGGEVGVRADDVGDGGVLFSVIDSGIGIDRSDLDRIFNPFEQVDSKTNREYGGSGIGLSLARTFIELHGGRIWAESDGRGAGSVFKFIIPEIAETGRQVEIRKVGNRE